MEIRTVRLTRNQLGFIPKRNHVYHLNVLIIVISAFTFRNFYSEGDVVYFLISFATLLCSFGLLFLFEVLRFAGVEYNPISIFESKYNKEAKTRSDKVKEFWEDVKNKDENIIVLLDQGKAQPYRKTIHSWDTKETQHQLSLVWDNILLYSVDRGIGEICLEGMPSYYKNTTFQES